MVHGELLNKCSLLNRHFRRLRRRRASLLAQQASAHIAVCNRQRGRRRSRSRLRRVHPASYLPEWLGRACQTARKLIAESGLPLVYAQASRASLGGPKFAQATEQTEEEPTAALSYAGSSLALAVGPAGAAAISDSCATLPTTSATRPCYMRRLALPSRAVCGQPAGAASASRAGPSRAKRKGASELLLK